MRSAAELRALRAGTKAFIDANAVTLILIPRLRQKSGTGTILVPQPARAPQVMRLIDQSTSSSPTPGLVQTSDGRERLIDFFLLGEYTAAVGLWDFWTDVTGTWEVAQVFPPNDYEVRAAVVRHA